MKFYVKFRISSFPHRNNNRYKGSFLLFQHCLLLSLSLCIQYHTLLFRDNFQYIFQNFQKPVTNSPQALNLLAMPDLQLSYFSFCLFFYAYSWHITLAVFLIYLMQIALYLFIKFYRYEFLSSYIYQGHKNACIQEKKSTRLSELYNIKTKLPPLYGHLANLQPVEKPCHIRLM